ncbi:hypothetical protein [Nocardioides sp. GY 10127]|uniref:hypothetical protein n=1 Tax=Nocardioides sp. GY 10127 TaxID=2569762 RepID=UPI0014588C87|nr:hypothetical protein [Nocardioides sp. GY 10127]
MDLTFGWAATALVLTVLWAVLPVPVAVAVGRAFKAGQGHEIASGRPDPETRPTARTPA